MATEIPNSPKDEDVIVNYCPVCGRTERHQFKEGKHWETPFFYGDAWWARGSCPSCTQKQTSK
ncbi:MAG: hypothetical protein O2783_07015 [Chloroflexi bacterium]|nr:hypothetical protein [Chloroflexota bacterium]